jgi:hypothetical protein
MDNPFPSTLGTLLHEFYSASFGPVILDTAAYVKAQGIDPKMVEAHAGTASLFSCTFDSAGYFDFAEGGESCLVFEVLDEDAATTIDLCAFAVATPKRFGTAMGNAPVLGLTNITNPASWAFGTVMPIHRTPLGWLRDDCRGVVILDHQHAPAALGRALGKLLAEDEEHATELRPMLCSPPVDPRNIIFKKATARRAA